VWEIKRAPADRELSVETRSVAAADEETARIIFSRDWRAAESNGRAESEALREPISEERAVFKASWVETSFSKVLRVPVLYEPLYKPVRARLKSRPIAIASPPRSRSLSGRRRHNFVQDLTRSFTELLLTASAKSTAAAMFFSERSKSSFTRRYAASQSSSQDPAETGRGGTGGGKEVPRKKKREAAERVRSR
tara:strand:+ start:158 stop:736 length:579 start_codon:yes stop_codon:yes gene_type:complete